MNVNNVHIRFVLKTAQQTVMLSVVEMSVFERTELIVLNTRLYTFVCIQTCIHTERERVREKEGENERERKRDKSETDRGRVNSYTCTANTFIYNTENIVTHAILTQQPYIHSYTYTRTHTYNIYQCINTLIHLHTHTHM